MGVIKGSKEYKKFQENKPLTRKQAILAQCYLCNGENEGGVDCGAQNCPLYQYFPNKATRSKVHAKFKPENDSFVGFQDKEIDVANPILTAS